METLFIYLVKSGALVATFFFGYYFLLRKETFFNGNRWYLLVGLVTALVLPLVTFEKVVFVEVPKQMAWSTLSDFPAATAITPIEETFEINWLLVLACLYGVGIAVFLFKFLMDFYALRKVLKGKQVQQQADFKFVDLNENISPFSYFNYIVFNSALYSRDELDNILEHEKAHSSQNHTFDVLFSRLFCIVFWFNPFAWLYKKAILQNLEFIADSEATKNIADKKSYQITLLKITTHDHCVEITNHFYQSLIKKRIVMLNKNQSKKWNSWKYLLVIPALAAFMFYFQVNVIAQEKETVLPDGSTISSQTHEVTDMTWTKNTTDEEFKNDAAEMKKSGITFKFSKIKRNANGEIIAIKLSYKDKLGNQQTKNISGDQPIEPIHFFRDIDQSGKGQIGFMSPPHVYIKSDIAYSDGDNDSMDDSNYDSDNNDVGDDITNDITNDIIDTPEPPEAPEPNFSKVPKAPKAPQTYSKVITKTDKNGRTVVTVNGEVVVDTDKIIADMDPIVVDGMDVLKGERYNPKTGRKATVIIDTKKIQREALEQARQAMEDARPEIENAKREIENSRREIERSKPEIENSRREIERSKPEIENAKREIENSRKEIEAARKEIAQAKLELQKEKAALQKQKADTQKK